MSISIFYTGYYSFSNTNRRSRGGYRRRRRLIRDHDVVRSEAPAIDSVLIVRLALVISGVLLRRRVDLHFRLYRVVTNGPLVYLANSNEFPDSRSIVRETF